MNPRFAMLCLTAICTLCAFAGEPPPPPKGVKVERDIPYVPNGDPAQVLDIYLPETPSDKPLPIVVSIHGGGWQGGSKSGCLSAGYATFGYAAASIEYRFSQKAIFPAQIQDCQAAIRFLRANAKKYNIDPDRIGVWGDSAGGHLVSLLGTTGGKKAFPMIGGNEDQSDRVQAVCNFYGPANFNTVITQANEDKNVKSIFQWGKDPYSQLIGGGLGQDKAKCDAVSPVHYVDKDSAPMLILHGTHDKLVPFAQSEELAAAMKKAGAEVYFQKLPGAGHGGGIFYGPQSFGMIKAFFNKYLKDPNAKFELLPEESMTVTPPEPAKK